MAAGTSVAILNMVKTTSKLVIDVLDGFRKYPERAKELRDVMSLYKGHEDLVKRVTQALEDNLGHRKLHSDVILNYLNDANISLEEAKWLAHRMKRVHEQSEAAATSSDRREKPVNTCFTRFTRMFTMCKTVGGEAFNIENFSENLVNLKQVHKSVGESLFNVLKYLDPPIPDSKGTDYDSYEPYYSAPLHQSRSNMVLDFNVNDDEHVETTEGRLKQLLLKRNKDGTICVSGDVPKIGGAYGMGGVGKTITLQALCEEEDVRAAFKDGVYFFEFGMDATDKMVQEKIADCVCDFGGKKEGKEIRSLRELDRAVEKGTSWFTGRSVLFVCDDMWPSEKNKIGYLDLMRGLMKKTEKSRMIFSTRVMTIASEADHHVKFGCELPQSAKAREILFSWAFGGKDSKCSLGTECEDAVTYVLGKCAGLHLALSIAGSAVKQNILKCSGDRTRALQKYVRSLKNEEVLITDGTFKDYGGLQQLIQSSLSRCIQWGNSRDVETAYEQTFNMNEIFQALCVFSKQMVMPMSALTLLWNFPSKRHTRAVMNELEEYQLANQRPYMNASSQEEEDGLSLHDLVLETCQVLAGRDKIKSWHSQILNAYSPVPSTVNNGDGWNEETRAWWDIKDDGYLHNNISRHLARAGLREELKLLVCDVRWVQKCAEGKGWIGFESDMDELQNSEHITEGNGLSVLPRESDMDELQDGKQISEGNELSVLRRVLKCNWEYILTNPKWFGFQVFGGLGLEERRLRLVARLLLTIEQYLTRPWAKPAKKCLYAIDEREVECHSLQNLVHDLVVDWGQRIMYVACGSHILVRNMMKRKNDRTLRGHTKNLTCLAVTRDGSKIVSGSYDCTVRLWDVKTGKICWQALEGHTKAVTCLTITGDESRVVSGSLDGTIHRWNMETGEVIGETIDGHTEAVTCFALTGDNRHMLSGSFEGSIHQWDMADGKVSGATMKGGIATARVTCMAVSGDGTLMVSGSADGSISLWNMKTEHIIWSVNDHKQWVCCLAMTGDGRIFSGSFGKAIRQWDIKTGESSGTPLTGHTKEVTCLAIAGDAKLMVSGSGDGSIREWNMTARESFGEATKEYMAMVTCISMASDGELMASGSKDGSIRGWNMKTGEITGKAVEGHKEEVTCLTIIHDGRYIVSGSNDCTIRQWDLTTGDSVGKIFEGHSQGVTCLAITSDERHMVSGSYDGTIRRWDMASGESTVVSREEEMKWVTSLAITSNRRQMVAASLDGSIRRRNMKTGEIIGEELKGYKDKVTCLAITADERKIVSGSYGGTIVQWDVETGKIIGRATNEEFHWMECCRRQDSQEWNVPVSFNLTGWVKSMVPGHAEAVYMGGNKFAIMLRNEQVVVVSLMV